MTIPNEYIEICKMLLDATSNDRVDWKVKGLTFIVRLPEFNIELWSGTDESDEKEFVAIGLRDHVSRKIIDNWYVEEHDKDFGMMKQLYDAVRRRAHRIPEKLDTLRKLLMTNTKLGMDEDEKF